MAAASAAVLWERGERPFRSDRGRAHEEVEVVRERSESGTTQAAVEEAETSHAWWQSDGGLKAALGLNPNSLKSRRYFERLRNEYESSAALREAMCAALGETLVALDEERVGLLLTLIESAGDAKLVDAALEVLSRPWIPGPDQRVKRAKGHVLALRAAEVLSRCLRENDVDAVERLAASIGRHPGSLALHLVAVEHLLWTQDPTLAPAAERMVTGFADLPWLHAIAELALAGVRRSFDRQAIEALASTRPPAPALEMRLMRAALLALPPADALSFIRSQSVRNRVGEPTTPGVQVLEAYRSVVATEEGRRRQPGILEAVSVSLLEAANGAERHYVSTILWDAAANGATVGSPKTVERLRGFLESTAPANEVHDQIARTHVATFVVSRSAVHEVVTLVAAAIDRGDYAVAEAALHSLADREDAEGQLRGGADRGQLMATLRVLFRRPLRRSTAGACFAGVKLVERHGFTGLEDELGALGQRAEGRFRSLAESARRASESG